MLNWVLAFFVIALIASFLGFGGVAGTAMGAGSMLLRVFLVLVIVGLVIRVVKGG